MKRIAALLALGVLSLSATALAEDPPNNDNNTFIVTTSDGTAMRYHIDSDGKWDVVAPNGQTANGTYTIEDDQICMTATGETQASCVQNNPDKVVGDTWTQKGGDGSDVTISLVAGRP